MSFQEAHRVFDAVRDANELRSSFSSGSQGKEFWLTARTITFVLLVGNLAFGDEVVPLKVAQVAGLILGYSCLERGVRWYLAERKINKLLSD